MNGNENKKLKVKDIITVVLLAHDQRCSFLCQLPAVCDAIYHYAYADLFLSAGRNRVFHHWNEGEKAWSDFDLQHCAFDSGRLSALYSADPDGRYLRRS